MFGQAGNDRMIWNPDDGTDLNEDGAGIDTVEVNGGNGAETFTVTPNGTRVRFDRVDPAPFSIDIGTSENLVVNMNGGDDTFTASNGLASLISLTVDGGAGNHSSTGGEVPQAGKVTRLLGILRAQALIAKVPKTHRSQLTEKKRTSISTLLAARHANVKQLLQAA